MVDIDNQIKKDIANRQFYNKEIIKILDKIVEEYPDLRFGQILTIFAEIESDPFYIESRVTHDILKSHLKYM